MPFERFHDFQIHLEFAQQNQNINFSVNPANMASGYNALSSLASMTGSNSLPQMPSAVAQQLPDQNFQMSVNPATIANGLQAAASIGNSLAGSSMFSGSQIPLVPKRPNSNDTA